MNWLTKIAGWRWIYTDRNGNRVPCSRSSKCDATKRSKRWLMTFEDGEYLIPRDRLTLEQDAPVNIPARQMENQLRFNW